MGKKSPISPKKQKEVKDGGKKKGKSSLRRKKKEQFPKEGRRLAA